MSRRALLALPIAALLVVLTLAANGAGARGTLDQSNTAPSADALVQTNDPADLLGQTFTAGVSGLLDTATLYLEYVGQATTVTVGLFATGSTGMPTTQLASATATVAASSTSPNLSPSQYTAFVFTAPATVIAGKKYALVITSVQGAEGEIFWFFSSPATYTRGTAVASYTGVGGPYEPFGELSFDFQTFVTPPATTTPTSTPSIVFVSPEFSLSTSGCGTTNPPPGPVLVNNLQNVIVTAIPCPGSRFTGWTNGPCNGTTVNPCDISPMAGVLTANFSP